MHLLKFLFLKKGSFLLSPDGFHSDVYLTVKLLLPGFIKSVYNLNDKHIVRLFSRVFNCSPGDMAQDLEKVRGRGGLWGWGSSLRSTCNLFSLVGAHCF